MESASANKAVDPMISAILAYIGFTRYRMRIASVGNKDEMTTVMPSLTAASLDSPYDLKPVPGKGEVDCLDILSSDSWSM